MNKKINLAVAGAVLLASATAANAGIIIPAGEWTMDINGNVNAFYTYTDVKTVGTGNGIIDGLALSGTDDTRHDITTGLLPSWLGFTGTTRQNDLDVSFTVSFQTGVAENTWHGDGSNGGGNNSTVLNRQTFVTFGDKTWGTVKLGKDLGIYASDAILNDMTLLGVGAGTGAQGATQNTTFGGIGTGYQYAAWKGQLSYTTPNMNGLQATIGVTNPNMMGQGADSQDRLGIEAKVSYDAAVGSSSVRVWSSAASYDVTQNAVTGAWSAATASTNTQAASTFADSYTVSAYDLGARVSIGNLGVVAYLYDGNANGTTALGLLGRTTTGTNVGVDQDGSGGYLQATYVIPTGTKLGAAYGVSRLDSSSATGHDEQNRWTVGAYHPLTKHLNLVAEFNNVASEDKNAATNDLEYNSLSLGAILFF